MRLNAFSYHRQSERPTHLDNRSRDGDVFGLLWQVANERTVNLDGIYGEPFRDGHRRIAGSEIVDGKTHAPALYCIQHLNCLFAFSITMLSVISIWSNVGSMPLT